MAGCQLLGVMPTAEAAKTLQNLPDGALKPGSIFAASCQAQHQKSRNKERAAACWVEKKAGSPSWITQAEFVIRGLAGGSADKSSLYTAGLLTHVHW